MLLLACVRPCVDPKGHKCCEQAPRGPVLRSALNDDSLSPERLLRLGQERKHLSKQCKPRKGKRDTQSRQARSLGLQESSRDAG